MPVPLITLSVSPPLSSNTVPLTVKLVNGMVIVPAVVEVFVAESTAVKVKLSVPEPLKAGSTVSLVESKLVIVWLTVTAILL